MSDAGKPAAKAKLEDVLRRLSERKAGERKAKPKADGLRDEFIELDKVLI